MRNDERTQLELHALEEEAGENSGDPVVFDLSGTEKANVEDIAMILTARLQSAPTNQVWVHSIPVEDRAHPEESATGAPLPTGSRQCRRAELRGFGSRAEGPPFAMFAAGAPSRMSLR